MIIRDEQPKDRPLIHDLLAKAFGGPDEAELVRALFQAGAVEICLLAEEGTEILAMVLLSKMSAPFPALALAPVATDQTRQRTGLASALILEAIERARTRGWVGIFVLGDPAFYGRFGFRVEEAAAFQSPYAGPNFMVLALSPPLPTLVGSLAHAAPFDVELH